MKLYEIDQRIDNILFMQDEEGWSDDDIRDTLESLMMDKYEKCVSVALAIKNMEKDIEAFKKEEEILRRRKNALDKKVSWLKEYLSGSLAREEIKNDPRVRVSYRSSEKVVIDDIEMVPEKFLHYKPLKPEVAKQDIKEAIKSGEDVPGAMLISCSNIQIK